MSRDTRQMRAQKLLERLERGPSFVFMMSEEQSDAKVYASTAYRLWAQTWVIPDLIELIPELRKGREA